MSNCKTTRGGFTLVELSVVLVIIGLLAGGIMAGQSLIRNSQMKAVITESQRYTTAIQTFKEKYFALPGDMPNATAYWGIDATNCPGTGAATDVNATPGTCNGNGDGTITYGGAYSAPSEAFEAWNQLALAGMIEGSYTGLAGPDVGFGDPGVGYTFGTNSPASKVPLGGWGITYFDNSSGGNTVDFAQNYLNWLTFGSYNGAYADGPLISPQEAWNIDKKLDDGMPAQGDVQSWRQSSAADSCTISASNTDTSATYNLNSSTSHCAVYFKY